MTFEITVERTLHVEAEDEECACGVVRDSIAYGSYREGVSRAHGRYTLKTWPGKIVGSCVYVPGAKGEGRGE